jgi:hypothetical protein
VPCTGLPGVVPGGGGRGTEPAYRVLGLPVLLHPVDPRSQSPVPLFRHAKKGLRAGSRQPALDACRLGICEFLQRETPALDRHLVSTAAAPVCQCLAPMVAYLPDKPIHALEPSGAGFSLRGALAPPDRNCIMRGSIAMGAPLPGEPAWIALSIAGLSAGFGRAEARRRLKPAPHLLHTGILCCYFGEGHEK